MIYRNVSTWGEGGSQVCLIDIMTSEIQKVSANELLLNKFQLSKC